jgi:molybdenum cofactor cytidylyltransferase
MTLPQAACGILVVPGDQPGLSATDIQRCVEAFRETGKNIVIGSWQGKRGHPIVFPSSLVPFVMSEACSKGLRELPRQHEALVRTIECGSPAAVRNINTASEYETFRESKEKGNTDS